VFRQDRTNPSSAVSNWKGRRDTPKAWPSTAVSSWLNGGLFGGGGEAYNGYITGGQSSDEGSTYSTTSEKWPWISMTKSIVSSALESGSVWTSGANDNGVAGYTANGYGPSPYGSGNNLMSKLLYATDTRTDLSDTAYSGYGVGGHGNSGTAGYWMGGSTAVMIKNASKVSFTTGSVSELTDVFTYVNGIYVGDASAWSGVAGYYAGGIRSTSSDLVDKFTYSTEATAVLSNTMTCASYYTRCTSNQGTAQYQFPGNACTTTVNKMPFATETPAALSSGLSTGRYYMAVMCNKGDAVYAANADSTTEFDKWVVASDTRSTVADGSDRKNGPSTYGNQDWS